MERRKWRRGGGSRDTSCRSRSVQHRSLPCLPGCRRRSWCGGPGTEEETSCKEEAAGSLTRRSLDLALQDNAYKENRRRQEKHQEGEEVRTGGGSRTGGEEEVERGGEDSYAGGGGGVGFLEMKVVGSESVRVGGPYCFSCCVTLRSSTENWRLRRRGKRMREASSERCKDGRRGRERREEQGERREERGEEREERRGKRGEEREERRGKRGEKGEERERRRG